MQSDMADEFDHPMEVDRDELKNTNNLNFETKGKQRNLKSYVYYRYQFGSSGSTKAN